jgi:hypothetical protein
MLESVCPISASTATWSFRFAADRLEVVAQRVEAAMPVDVERMEQPSESLRESVDRNQLPVLLFDVARRFVFALPLDAHPSNAIAGEKDAIGGRWVFRRGPLGNRLAPRFDGLRPQWDTPLNRSLGAREADPTAGQVDGRLRLLFLFLLARAGFLLA